MNTYTGVTHSTGGTLSVATIGDVALLVVSDKHPTQQAILYLTAVRCSTPGRAPRVTARLPLMQVGRSNRYWCKQYILCGHTGAATTGPDQDWRGSLTITGANTYTGATTISGGVISPATL